MKNLIKNYPNTVFYTGIAALQLIGMWHAILANMFNLQAVLNLVFALALVCKCFEIDMLNLEKKDARREN